MAENNPSLGIDCLCKGTAGEMIVVFLFLHVLILDRVLDFAGPGAVQRARAISILNHWLTIDQGWFTLMRIGQDCFFFLGSLFSVEW